MAHRLYRRAALTAVSFTVMVMAGLAQAQTRQSPDCRYQPNYPMAYPYFIDSRGCLMMHGSPDGARMQTGAADVATTGAVSQAPARRASNSRAATRAARAQASNRRVPDCRYEPNQMLAAPYFVDHNGCLRMRGGMEDTAVTGAVGQVPNAGRIGGPLGPGPGVNPPGSGVSPNTGGPRGPVGPGGGSPRGPSGVGPTVDPPAGTAPRAEVPRNDPPGTTPGTPAKDPPSTNPPGKDKDPSPPGKDPSPPGKDPSPPGKDPSPPGKDPNPPGKDRDGKNNNGLGNGSEPGDTGYPGNDVKGVDPSNPAHGSGSGPGKGGDKGNGGDKGGGDKGGGQSGDNGEGLRR